MQYCYNKYSPDCFVCVCVCFLLLFIFSAFLFSVLINFYIAIETSTCWYMEDVAVHRCVIWCYKNKCHGPQKNIDTKIDPMHYLTTFFDYNSMLNICCVVNMKCSIDALILVDPPMHRKRTKMLTLLSIVGPLDLNKAKNETTLIDFFFSVILFSNFICFHYLLVLFFAPNTVEPHYNTDFEDLSESVS